MSFIAGSAPGPPRFCPGSWGLNLDGLADCRRVAGRDYQISPLGLCRTPDDLPDWPGRVDDGGAGWIGHERRERLQRSAAVGLVRQRQHVFLLRFEPGDGGLQHLDQALVEQRHAGRRFYTLRGRFRRERELRDLTGDAEV